MRMLNSVQLPGCTDVDLYPEHLQSEINEINDLVYDKVGLHSYTASAHHHVQCSHHRHMSLPSACNGHLLPGASRNQLQSRQANLTGSSLPAGAGKHMSPSGGQNVASAH